MRQTIPRETWRRWWAQHCQSAAKRQNAAQKRMPKLLEVIKRKETEILRIIEEHGGTNAAVFGSVARGEDDEESDVDLLIDLKPSVEATPQTIQEGHVASMTPELEALLGREVHIKVRKWVPALVRKRISKEPRIRLGTPGT